ncbi:MAG: HlyD family secretion protein [Acidobacteria bacterium]|nr:HlyD family secretion protein [Acidobacteriota bacterium]
MKKKRKKKIAIWATVAFAVFAFTGYWTFGFSPAPKPVVETAAVELGDLSVELPATGSIDAFNVVDVGAVVSGRIEKMYADFNQRVKAGQLLAQIEDSLYRAIYLQAKGDLATARAGIEVAQAALDSARQDEIRAASDLQGAQAQYDKAQLDLERYQKLLKDGLATQADFEHFQTAYLSTKADRDSAQARVEQARTQTKSAAAALVQARALAEQRAAALAVAKQNLDYCRITSPVDGVIVSRNMDVGQTVAAAFQAPSLYNVAEDLTHMYVYTKLDSSDVAKVRPGLPAFFTVNSFPGETFTGKLIQIRINANAITPISRATASVGQIKRSITEGTTIGSTAGSQVASTTTTGAPSGTATTGTTGSTTGAAGTTGTTSTTPAAGSTTSTTTGASSPPPTGTINTVVVYDAMIEFSNPGERLLPGMTAYVTIPIGAVKNKLKVPNAALRFSPDIPEAEKQRLLKENGFSAATPHVWVVLGEKKYKPVAVKPLLTDYVMTAVESAELKPGLQVATRITETKPPST